MSTPRFFPQTLVIEVRGAVNDGSPDQVPAKLQPVEVSYRDFVAWAASDGLAQLVATANAELEAASAPPEAESNGNGNGNGAAPNRAQRRAKTKAPA